MPRTFRSKTLAGRVRARPRSPQSEVCLLHTNFCLPWTGDLWQQERFDYGNYSSRLAELKSDLRQALTDVQVHEKEIAGPVVQASRFALDELEVGLKEMLQQVEQEKRKRRRRT